MRRTTHPHLLTSGFVLLVAFVFSAIQVNAQRDASRPRRNAEAEMLERRRREQERMMNSLLLESAMKRQPERPAPTLAYDQIREDYAHLQIANNQMIGAVSSREQLDYKVIATAVTEIAQRANRLKRNLILPEPEVKGRHEAPQAISTTEQLMSALLVLDKTIMSFVNNPLFRNPKIVDAKGSVQIRRDLEEMVALSKRVKKYTAKFRS